MILVTNCGHDSHHPKPCNIEYKNGLPDYLLLLVKKDSWFYLQGTKKSITPNTVLLFPPQTYIHYGCDSAGYNDDWIHFSFTDAAEKKWLEDLSIACCQELKPYDFHRLSLYVEMLSNSFHNMITYEKEISDALIRAFLLSLKEELIKTDENSLSRKYYSEFSNLRTRLYNNPADDWTVPNMADSIALSLSYFQHLYKEFFSCSCQQDIITARLSLARFYLTNTDMNIKSLAEFCGYENELHFMRQFKKFVGMTPTEYRSKKLCLNKKVRFAHSRVHHIYKRSFLAAREQCRLRLYTILRSCASVREAFLCNRTQFPIA